MPGIKLLVYGLGLSAVLASCKTQDVSSVTPFKYTFKGLSDTKLPDVKPTAPAAVSVTAASVTIPEQAAAVNAGLSNIAATGQVPAAVQQAATDVNKAVPAATMTQLSSAMTPEALKSVASSGKIPADWKANMTAIANNPALKAYMPSYTLPVVNGKAVSGRVGTVAVVEAVAVVYAPTNVTDDPCQAAANADYNAAAQNLTATRDAQAGVVNANFTTQQTAIQGETAPCKTSATTKGTTLMGAAQQTLTGQLNNLSAAQQILGDDATSALTIMTVAAYSGAQDAITTVQSAETKACDVVADAKTTNAKAAQQTDLNQINTNYNNALGGLNSALKSAVGSCHNQGRIGVAEEGQE
jgi:hypothetical protein